MPTYTEYLAYAKAKRFQPLSQSTFDSLIRAKINPINK